MVLDCDVCMEYWVSNGSNMKGYEYLASNRHIPMAYHPAENNSMHTQPPVQDSLPPEILINILPTNPDYTFTRSSELPAAASCISSLKMVLECDTCIQYWSNHGRYMEGYQLLIANQHIREAHSTENDNSRHTQDVQDSPPPQLLTNILPTNPDYTFKRSSELTAAGSITDDVLVPPLPPSDTSMLSQPDQSHNITIPEDPAMPTPPDQSSMPPAMLMTSQNHHTSTPTSSVDSEEITGVAEINNSTSHQYPYCDLCHDYASYSGDDYDGELWVRGEHISDAHWRESVNNSQNLETRPITDDDQHRKYWLTHLAVVIVHTKAFQSSLGPGADLEIASMFKQTALMVAVGIGPETAEFVEKLLNILTSSDLEMTDKDGRTALGIAAMVGNIEAAKLLVQNNPSLPNISSGCAAGFPIHCAAEYGHKEMLLYLLKVTTNKAYLNPFGRYGYGKKLLSDILKAEFYDVALFLMREDKRVSQWGAIKGLNLLAENPSAFSYGREEATFLNWFIKKCRSDSTDIWGNPKRSGCSLLYVQLSKLCGKLVPPLKSKQEGERLYSNAKELVTEFCMEGRETLFGIEAGPVHNKFKLPLLLAAANGIHEIIKRITVEFTSAMWFNSNYYSDIFRLAVSNRHHNVYNLIHEMGDSNTNIVRQSVDENGDSMLHWAAKLAPPQRLNLITGAASQMQHEVQWYKEIENLVPPRFRNLQNHAGSTPRDVFLNSHQKLMSEAETWMKGTATSCTVSAALIATVVFAAAITVPGGNSGENGIPMFARNKAFTIFGVADALSLFTSCVSILMFLSILTSRYAEHDFLYRLPKRLIIGLLALFVSIAFMMVAFSATLYLVFGAHKLWILTSVIAAAFLPVAIFASLQFSLLSEMISSTYGSSRFKSRRRTSFPTDTREEELLRLLFEEGSKDLTDEPLLIFK